jgi:hypothetical protein
LGAFCGFKQHDLPEHAALLILKRRLILCHTIEWKAAVTTTCGTVAFHGGAVGFRF